MLTINEINDILGDNPSPDECLLAQQADLANELHQALLADDYSPEARARLFARADALVASE